MQTHLEPLAEASAAREVDADAEALVRRVVREETGGEPRELRFLRTDGGLVAFLTLGLDGASRSTTPTRARARSRNESAASAPTSPT